MNSPRTPGRSLIDGLPPEIAKRINPDWQKNEAEYWKKRDSLLPQYSNQWIGFADGGVIASGTSPVEVFHTAQAYGKHPFVTCVGHENQPNRMRRTPLSYGSTYPNDCEIIESLARRSSNVSKRRFMMVIKNLRSLISLRKWLRMN